MVLGLRPGLHATAASRRTATTEKAKTLARISRLRCPDLTHSWRFGQIPNAQKDRTIHERDNHSPLSSAVRHPPGWTATGQMHCDRALTVCRFSPLFHISDFIIHISRFSFHLPYFRQARCPLSSRRASASCIRPGPEARASTGPFPPPVCASHTGSAA